MHVEALCVLGLVLVMLRVRGDARECIDANIVVIIMVVSLVWLYIDRLDISMV